MLFTQFLNHYLKSVFRNAMWRRNLTSKIVFGILMFYLLALFISIGYRIDSLLQKHGGSPVATFNSILIWYFLGDLTFRCMFQALPVIHVIPYLRFNIRKNSIINYLLVRNLWNIFNILPWLVIVPFSIKVLGPLSGGFAVTSYLAGVLLILLFNNFLSVFIKYLSQKQFLFILIPAVMIGIFYVTGRYIYPAEKLSAGLGQLIIRGNPAFYTVTVIAILLVFFLIRNMLLKGFYTDEIKIKRSGLIFSGFLNMELFNRFGVTGKYMDLELNLMLRNKRPRQGLVMMPLFVIYFLYIFSRDADKFSSGGWAVYFLSILIGFGGLIYGQYLFSWESSYMDGMMSRNHNLYEYIIAKYYFMSMLVLFDFVVTFIAFLFMKNVSMSLLVSITLFVLGVLQFIIIYMGASNDSRIDLSRSQFFNYQGVKGQQFLLAFAFFIIPVLIYSGIKAIAGTLAANMALALTGLVFIIFHPWWIKTLVIPRFLNRKYKNMEGYRKLTA